VVYSTGLELAGQGKIRSDIDEDFMHKVIHDIPVRVLDSQLDKNGLACFGTTDYPGFYAATEAFMESVKAMCEAVGVMPDRIILTGSASVMPFIKELITEVFYKKSILSKSGISFIRGADKDVRISKPALSVSEGLAFMGYVELQKHKAQGRTAESGSIYSARAWAQDAIWNYFLNER